MRNNPLDDIIKCKIDISSPASNDETFNSILLVVPEPEAGSGKSLNRVTAVSKADELLEYGFTAEDVAYLAAVAAFSQSPSPDELYICVRRKAAGEAKEETPEEEITEETGKTRKEAVYEDIRDTLERAVSEVGFYGFHITDFRDLEDIQQAMAWAESNEKLYGFEYTDYEKCPVKSEQQMKNYYRSFAVFSGFADDYGEGGTPTKNRYAALAWMAKCFGYDPGTETWHLKELAAVLPSALSAKQKIKLEAGNINMFLRYAGSNVTVGGFTLAGEWIDVIRFRDWLKAEMQKNVFNALKTNLKVPFTDAGISLIEGKMEETLKKGQDIGGIAPTEYDENDMEIPGFFVTVPKAADLTEAEKKSRKLAGCRYTAKLAGAVHAVEIEGFLTF